MNQDLAKALLSKNCNVSIMANNGVETGKKVAGFYGLSYFWLGDEISREEFIEKIDESVFRWDIY